MNRCAYPALAACLTALLIHAPQIRAKTLFEGYYRVEKARKHIGYLVQRLSEDPKTSTKTLTSYLRLDRNGKQVYLSKKVIARSGSGLAVSTDLQSTLSVNPEQIQANFTSGGQAQVVFSDPERKRPARKEKAAPTSMVSALLFFLTDFSKLKKDTDYRFYAFAENMGRTGSGTLRYLSDDYVQKQKVIQVVDEFIGQSVENFVTPAGLPLGARHAADELVAYWVPDRDAAVGLLDFPKKDIEKLFGGEPKGTTNPWSAIPDFRADIAIDGFARPVRPRVPSSADRKNPKPTPIPLPLRKF